MKIINGTIELTLPENWIEYFDENTNSLFSLVNMAHEESGVIQISFAKYINGIVPNPSKVDLQSMALNICHQNNTCVDIKEQKSGVCDYGLFGSVRISSLENRIFQIWILFDGKDFIMVSYISLVDENQEEITQANEIILQIKKSG